jgi:phage-related protein
MNKKEGNIISFRVFIDSKGNLVTEFKKLPEKEIKNIFDEHDSPLVSKIINELNPKLEGLHSHLEKELGVLR